MSIVQLAALLAPAAIVWLALGAALRESGRPWSTPLRLSLALGLGAGIASGGFFVALVACDARPAGLATVDALLAAPLLVAWWWGRRDPQPRALVPRPRWSRLDVALAAAAALAAAVSIAAFAAQAYAQPHGEVDAWSTWDAKARFFAAVGSRWRLTFEDVFGHPDYPLLLPGVIARGWRYGGRIDQTLPIAVAALFTSCSVALLYGALAGLRDRTVGLLAALCLLATPGFAWRAAWLYADVPLSFYLLASVVLWTWWQRGQRGSPAIVWAGIAAGLAAWTKREGLFCLAVLLVVSAASLGARRWRAVARLVLGAAAPLALRFALTAFAYRNATAGRGIEQLTARLSDPSRYAEIAAAVWRLLSGSPSRWLLLAIPAFVLLMGPTADRAARAAAARAALVLASLAALYAAIYLTTPTVLDWHLRTSLDRLVFHLWPSALFALFLWADTPAAPAAIDR